MNIEMMGVNYVELAICKTDYLVPHINSNDKEPSWDGKIEVYRKAGDVHPKSDLVLDVPVQIKGHKSYDLKKHSITYPVQIVDMENFLTDGGVVFMVVYIHPSGEKNQIYYSALLPYDLKRILKQSGEQATKNISLKKLPRGKNEIATLFLGIARDIKKQKAAIAAEIVSWEDLAKSGQLGEFNIGYSGLKKKGALPFDYFFDNGAYLYAKLSFGIELPMEHFSSVELVTTTREAAICAGGKQFYDKYDVVFKKDVIEIHIGKSIIHSINRKRESEQKFSFTLSGTLSERLRDEEFIIAALESKKFEIDNAICPLSDIEEEQLARFNIPEKKEHLEWLNTVKCLMDTLRVKVDLDCSSLTEKDEGNIRLLKSAILDNEPVPLNNIGDNVFGWFTIANLRLLVCVLKCKKKSGYYNIYGFNDTPLEIRANTKDGKDVPTSFYVLLNKDGMLECCNIDYQEMLENIKNTALSNKVSETVTTLLLQMIKAYDESSPKRKDILEAAERLADWLRSNDMYTPNEVRTLNYFQIIKRTRCFTQEEIREILAITEGQPDNEEYYVGAYLLLDNQKAAKAHFDLMKEVNQNGFKEYPIYHYWKQDE